MTWRGDYADTVLDLLGLVYRTVVRTTLASTNAAAPANARKHLTEGCRKTMHNKAQREKLAEYSWASKQGTWLSTQTADSTDESSWAPHLDISGECSEGGVVF